MRPMTWLLLLGLLASTPLAVFDPPAFLQLVLLAAVFYPLVRNKRFQQFLQQLPRHYQFGLIVLFVLLLAGHLTRSKQRTFPFVVWPMYGFVVQTNLVQSYTVIGITTEGTFIEINPNHLYPSVYRGLVIRLKWMCLSEEEQPLLRQTIRAIGNEYQKQTGISLREVRIYYHWRPLGSEEQTTELIAVEPIP